MKKTLLAFALFAFALLACTTDVKVEYRNVCTEADVPELRECVDTYKSDFAEKAEPMCVRLICIHQEAWLKHRESGGPPYGTDNTYEAPCAKVTDEDDREICTLAGYDYSEPDPNALAYDR